MANCSLAPSSRLRFLLVNYARSFTTVVSGLHPPGVSPHDFCGGDVNWKLSGDPNSVPGFPPPARGQSSPHDFCRGDVNWKLLTSLLSDVTS